MKKLTAIFYRNASGAQPVRDWLMSLCEGDRRIIGQDIATVEFGWPVGMPVCRSLGHGVWEIRSTIGTGRVEARLYFAAVEGQAVLLHGHTGKDLQQRAIALARERMTDFMARKGKANMSQSHHDPMGDSFESFLDELGIKDEVYGVAVKRVIAYQLEAARNGADLSKSAMAEAMDTSRTQLGRVLDPENVAVSLQLLARAAEAVGKRLKVELVDL